MRRVECGKVNPLFKSNTDVHKWSSTPSQIASEIRACIFVSSDNDRLESDEYFEPVSTISRNGQYWHVLVISKKSVLDGQIPWIFNLNGSTEGKSAKFKDDEKETWHDEFSCTFSTKEFVKIDTNSQYHCGYKGYKLEFYKNTEVGPVIFQGDFSAEPLFSKTMNSAILDYKFEVLVDS